MNKQKQIEEMEKIIDELYNVYDTTAGEIAEGLYSAGYRKIPKNAVVLTKEEYDKLGLFEESVQEYKSDNGQLILVKERKTLQKYSTDIADFIRKKTAKEILQEWVDDNSSMGLDNTFVNNIAKKYGVEVEE